MFITPIQRIRTAATPGGADPFICDELHLNGIAAAGFLQKTAKLFKLDDQGILKY